MDSTFLCVCVQKVNFGRWIQSDMADGSVTVCQIVFGLFCKNWIEMLLNTLITIST